MREGAVMADEKYTEETDYEAPEGQLSSDEAYGDAILWIAPRM